MKQNKSECYTDNKTNNSWLVWIIHEHNQTSASRIYIQGSDLSARVRGSDDEGARARARTCICSSLDAVVDLSIWGNVKKRVDEKKRRGFMMEGINEPRRRRRRNSFRLWGAFLIITSESLTKTTRRSGEHHYRRVTDARVFINIRGSGEYFRIYSEKWAFVLILNHNRPSVMMMMMNS